MTRAPAIALSQLRILLTVKARSSAVCVDGIYACAPACFPVPRSNRLSVTLQVMWEDAISSKRPVEASFASMALCAYEFELCMPQGIVTSNPVIAF